MREACEAKKTLIEDLKKKHDEIELLNSRLNLAQRQAAELSLQLADLFAIEPERRASSP